MPLSHLNEEQLQAATAPLGHNLIIASAGTGKTSTIVARIGFLLKENVKPQEILLLTFTNKAATQMIDRVAKLFGKDMAKKIEAGTFHAVSYRLLKSLGKNILLKQPRELKMLLKTVYAKRKFHHIDAQVTPYQATTLYDLNSLFQNNVYEKEFSKWIENNHPQHEPFALIYEDILEEFKEQKNRFGYVDFNDILIYMKEELQKENSINFTEILVDEYQDTNSLQSTLIDSFQAKSLFCVGDYDQSIYAFNGANIENIGTFSQRYDNVKVFTLTKNYRSSKPILSLANTVIQNNPRLYEKKLEVTRNGTFTLPKLLIYDELFAQYQAIASLIKQSDTEKENIAVIFRNNASADGIEASLREYGLSCKRKGGISFFDSKEVKALIDILSICTNPKDMMAFIHLFEYAKGVGAALAKEIFDALFLLGDGDISKGFLNPKDEANPFNKPIKNYQLGLFDEHHELGSVGRFYPLGFDENFLSNPILKHSKLNDEGANYLFYMYTILKESKRIKNPASLTTYINNSTLFKSISLFLAKQRATQKDGTINEELQQEALSRIERKALLLRDMSSNYKQCERFLNALTLGSSEMSEGEGVNLLSVHASKGLEFNEVYVVDLMDGRFPNRKLMSGGGGIEEERRLFYVATTRAKDTLLLSYARYDKIKRQNYEPSIFLKEAKLVE